MSAEKNRKSKYIILTVIDALVMAAVLLLARLITGAQFSLFSGVLFIPICVFIQMTLDYYIAPGCKKMYLSVTAIAAASHFIVLGFAPKKLLYFLIYIIMGFLGLVFGTMAYKMRK